MDDQGRPAGLMGAGADAESVGALRMRKEGRKGLGALSIFVESPCQGGGGGGLSAESYQWHSVQSN